MNPLPLLDEHDINQFKKHCSEKIPQRKRKKYYYFGKIKSIRNARPEIERFFKRCYDEKIIGLLPSYIFQDDMHGFNVLVFSEKHITHLFYHTEDNNLDIISNVDTLENSTFEFRFAPRSGELQDKGINWDETIAGQNHIWFISENMDFYFNIISDNKLYTPTKLESLLVNEVSTFLSKTKFYPKKVGFEIGNDVKELAREILTYPNSGYRKTSNNFDITPINYERTNKNLADILFKRFNLPASGGNINVSKRKFFISTNDSYNYNESIYKIYDSIVMSSKLDEASDHTI